jgi:hypothetical protein
MNRYSLVVSEANPEPSGSSFDRLRTSERTKQNGLPLVVSESNPEPSGSSFDRLRTSERSKPSDARQ